MAKFTTRAPVAGDIKRLVDNMRAGDRLELQASHGYDLEEAVRHALLVSQQSWAFEIDGQLMMIGGIAVVDLLAGHASPWMLGTDLMDRAPGALMAIGKEYRDLASGQYSLLFNYIDARNVKSIRWVRRLGFKVADEPVLCGPRKLPFYRFEMRK